VRKSKVRRETRESKVKVEVDLEGTGYDIKTDIPFFNHMLESFAFHSGIKINVEASGDLKHHIIEDVGIALGEAIKKALGEKRGIRRFGSSIVPMDESVALCGIDISGRGVFNFEGEIKGEVEGIEAELMIHFLESFCRVAGINVYVQVKGRNLHHMIEAMFKAVAMSFGDAIKVEGDEIRSTKGLLGD